MIVEISPEPSPAEREAIEAALRAVPAGGGDGRGDWWKEGLGENLSTGAGLDESQATGFSAP